MTDTGINHPAYESTIAAGTERIITFRVGRIEHVPPEVRQAHDRIRSIINQIAPADVSLLQEWSGRLHVTSPQSRIVNPPLTDAMRADFIAAVQTAYPDAALTSWDNMMHGLSGFSVRVGRTSHAELAALVAEGERKNRDIYYGGN